ncbi:MAG: sigma-54 dependent transcriptional regulator [Alphaproteobacteria bacterium]|nr:sigma-54 dependent transcriptional regulator [Alphaproteobacteria bacterium]
MPKPSVLLIEDTRSLVMLYEQYLAAEDLSVTSVETGRAGLEAIRQAAPDLVLLDIALPDMNGLDILREIQRQENPSAVVIITANGSINIAIEAMREGAFDFLVKPFNADRLRTTVRAGLEGRKFGRSDAFPPSDDHARRYGFIGESAAMHSVYRTIDSAAGSKATVFITGESGTGKELCAEAVHRQSHRRDGPFIALNCGAIPRELMESEIFGHRKGGFTGAHEDRDGAAQLAHGGTLFLDEICEMDLDLQTKLLRFIQTGAFQRVGDATPRKVDVRFVCATNRDALAEVAAGRFREDLYYRLHVIPIQLPPLRDRGTDILEIAKRFLADYAGEEGKAFHAFDPEAEAVMMSYPWPGNVRQLQNVVRNAVVLNDGAVVTRDMLPPPLNVFRLDLALRRAPDAPSAAAPGARTAPTPMRRATDRPNAGGVWRGEGAPPETQGSAGLLLPRSKAEIRELWLVEKDAIENAIRLCGGNIPQAAGYLGVAPSTIYRKRAAWDQADRKTVAD